MGHANEYANRAAGDQWVANYNAHRFREDQLIDGADAILAIHALRARGWLVRHLAELAGCPESTLRNVTNGKARTITRGRSTILVAAAALDWAPTDTGGAPHDHRRPRRSRQRTAPDRPHHRGNPP